MLRKCPSHGFDELTQIHIFRNGLQPQLKLLLDVDTPLILGRPFMKTERMMIDIDDGLMKLRFQDEEVCFDLSEAMKHPSDKGDCFRIDDMEEVIMQVESQVHVFNPLEKTLTKAFDVLNEEEEKEIEECLRDLDAFEE